jgi:adenylate kinase family enzyme
MAFQGRWRHCFSMQRILVMGPPGCGKSTLARHIGERYGLPVFHLDQAYWQAG